MSNTPSNTTARDIAEQHHSLFNLKALVIDNHGKVVDGSKVSKFDSKGLASEKWGRILNVLTHWKDIESSIEEAQIQLEYQWVHASKWTEDRADFHCWKMIHEVEEGWMQNGNTVRRLVRKEDVLDPSDR
jgi:hypothetical protein